MALAKIYRSIREIRLFTMKAQGVKQPVEAVVMLASLVKTMLILKIAKTFLIALNSTCRCQTILSLKEFKGRLIIMSMMIYSKIDEVESIEKSRTKLMTYLTQHLEKSTNQKRPQVTCFLTLISMTLGNTHST
jgi:hypothetical protein